MANLISINVKSKKTMYRTINLFGFSDSNLSWKAKGLLCYLMTRPKDWKLWMKNLINCSSNGEVAIQAGINELKRHNYLHRGRICENGKIKCWIFIVTSEPVPTEEIDKKEIEKIEFLYKGRLFLKYSKNDKKPSPAKPTLWKTGGYRKNKNFRKNNTVSLKDKDTVERTFINKCVGADKKNVSTFPDIFCGDKKQITGFLREVINLWNDIPGITKHKLEQNKTTLLIRNYISQLQKGTFLLDKKLDLKWKKESNITPEIQKKCFTEKEIIFALKRLKKYYTEGYEPTNKGILPKSLDLVFYRSPQSWNKTKEYTSWFLHAYANKPVTVEDNPYNVKNKYPDLYNEYLKDIFDLNYRSDVIEFNNNMEELIEFHKDYILPLCERNYDKDSHFGSIQLLLTQYKWWLNQERQNYIKPKYRKPSLLKTNNWVFLRMIDYFGRIEHVGEIISGREYDEYGNDPYYYGYNKP